MLRYPEATQRCAEWVMSCQTSEWIGKWTSKRGPEIQIQIPICYFQHSNPCNISMAIVKRKNMIHGETNVVYKDVQCTTLHQKLIFTVFFVTEL